jgi:secreted protein with Ig-like and vWFA domain
MLVAPADVINDANVGVVERGSGTSFSAETLQRLGIASHVVGQELKGDEAAELGVLSLIDHTHPTAAQLVNDATARDALADHRRES